jgi:hypothetical protein
MCLRSSPARNRNIDRTPGLAASFAFYSYSTKFSSSSFSANRSASSIDQFAIALPSGRSGGTPAGPASAHLFGVLLGFPSGRFRFSL